MGGVVGCVATYVRSCEGKSDSSSCGFEIERDTAAAASRISRTSKQTRRVGAFYRLSSPALSCVVGGGLHAFDWGMAMGWANRLNGKTQLSGWVCASMVQ